MDLDSDARSGSSDTQPHTTTLDVDSQPGIYQETPPNNANLALHSDNSRLPMETADIQMAASSSSGPDEHDEELVDFDLRVTDQEGTNVESEAQAHMNSRRARVDDVEDEDRPRRLPIPLLDASIGFPPEVFDIPRPIRPIRPLPRSGPMPPTPIGNSSILHLLNPVLPGEGIGNTPAQHVPPHVPPPHNLIPPSPPGAASNVIASQGFPLSGSDTAGVNAPQPGPAPSNSSTGGQQAPSRNASNLFAEAMSSLSGHRSTLERFMRNLVRDVAHEIFEREDVDVDKSKKLIDSLEVVPHGLICRLEQLSEAQVASEDGVGPGDAGCAVCWEKLLDPQGSLVGPELDGPERQDVHNSNEGETDAQPARPSSDPFGIFPDSEERNTKKLLEKHAASLKDIIVSLPCAHLFHATCLLPWFSKPQQNTCPTCRFNLDPEGLLSHRRLPSAPYTVIPIHFPEPQGTNVSAPNTSSNTSDTPVLPPTTAGPQPEVDLRQAIPTLIPPFITPSSQDSTPRGNPLINSTVFNFPASVPLNDASRFPGPTPPASTTAQSTQPASQQNVAGQGAPAPANPAPTGTPNNHHPLVTVDHVITFDVVVSGNPGFSIPTIIPRSSVGRVQTHPPQGPNTNGTQNDTPRQNASQTPNPNMTASVALDIVFHPDTRNLTRTLHPHTNQNSNTNPASNINISFSSNTDSASTPTPTPIPNFMPAPIPVPIPNSNVDTNPPQPNLPRPNDPSLPPHLTPQQAWEASFLLTPPPNAPPSFMRMHDTLATLYRNQLRNGNPPSVMSARTFTGSGDDWLRANGPTGMPRRKEWTLPPSPGLTLRQKVEKMEREAGLRCWDISCGYGPTDEDPTPERPKSNKQIVIRATGGDHPPVCEHSFHPACLVSAERVAGWANDNNNTDGHVEVSCPLCRSVGIVDRSEWLEGVNSQA